MDRLGHQQRSRRLPAARPSSRSIAQMGRTGGRASADTVATTTQ
jgi:hypothetical protein